MTDDSTEQDRWRILMDKLERLAEVDPEKARLIEAVIDELLELDRPSPPGPKLSKKGNHH
jgi:hypothetical protein